MKEGQASRTAELVAFARAVHQVIDRPLVLDDPIAPRLLGPRGKAALAGDPKRLGQGRANAMLRGGLVIRSRAAEDTLADAVARGVRQYVVLGAGFDTFAYRNPHPDVRVFEVDHPATQQAKRDRLAGASVDIPANLTFVPFDFTTGSLADAMNAAAFDPSRPAVVAWLGVSMYLTPEDVRSTLAYVGSLAAGTTIVFDYYLPPSALWFFPRFFYNRVLKRVAAAGEPWYAFYTPATIREELERAGFTQIETFDRTVGNPRYLGGRRDGLDMGPVMQIAIATRT